MPINAKVAEAYVEFEGRLSKLDRDLKKAEANVKKSAKKMEKDSKITLGGISGAALKAFSALSFVEAGFKAADAAVAASTGKMDQFAQILRTLPLGIGPAAASIENLINRLRGVNDEVERFQQINRRFANRQARARRRTEAGTQARGTAQGLADQAALVGLTGVDRVTEEQAQFLRKQQEQVDQLRKQGLEKEARDIETQAQKLADLRIREAKRAADEELRIKRNAEVERLRDELQSIREGEARDQIGRIQNVLGSTSRSVDITRQIAGGGTKPEVRVDGQDDVIALLRQLVNRNPALGAI